MRGFSHSILPVLDGVPWELDQLPVRTKQPRAKELDTITECPAGQANPKSLRPDNVHQHATTSTTDLSLHNTMDEFGEGGVKKVQKGQIRALAKMLSALRLRERGPVSKSKSSVDAVSQPSENSNNSQGL